jgi:hypothetical protein
MKKTTTNPMQKAHDAPRCAARSKRSAQACNSPAVKGWSVCRMHGAGGGAPSGCENGMWRHGERSHEARAFNRKLTELIKMTQRHTFS